MNVGIDNRIKEFVFDTMTPEEGVSTLYRSELTLINPNTEFKLQVPLQSFTIHQNFVEHYQDVVQAEVMITPQEYRSILENMQDLTCSLLLYPIDRTTTEDLFEIPPLTFDYTVFIDKREDIDKQYNSNIFNDNEEEGQEELAKKSQQRFTYKLTLISEEMRDLRYRGVNFTAKDTTVDAVIKWICNNFQVPHLKCVPIDNTKEYKHINIPPIMYIDNVFPYIQHNYGIYAKGLAYYFTNSTLYMYPCFDTSPDTSPVKQVIHICNANNSIFRGSPKYHTFKEEDIFITSTANIKVSPIDVAASENNGDNIITTNADALRDRFAPVGQDGKVEIGDSHQTLIQRGNVASNASSTSQNIKYAGCKNNIYESTTELASKEGSFMSATWSNCVPGVLFPGQSVVYHYSNNKGDMVTANGRLLGVVYLSRNSPMSSIELAISFVAGLIIYLEPERKNSDGKK